MICRDVSRYHNLRVFDTSDICLTRLDRYFLLINSEGVYMCNRRYDFYAVDGALFLTKLFPDSLFDGEMVTFLGSPSNSTVGPMFLLFDVMKYKGEVSHMYRCRRDDVITCDRVGMMASVM